MTTKELMKWHAQVHRRALERHRATPDANPVALQILELLAQEYEEVYQIMPDDQ